MHLGFTQFVSRAYGGDVCKGIDVAKDSFTGVTTATVTGGAATTGSLVVWRMEYSPSGVRLVLPLRATGIHDTPLAAGSKIGFLFDDDSVAFYTTVEPIEPVPGANTDAAYTTWEVNVPVAPELLAELASKRVEALRGPLPPREMTWTVFKGQGKKLMAATGCYGSLSK